MRIVAFDMGKRNFAFAEVDIDPSTQQWGNVITIDVHDFGSKNEHLFRDLILYLDRFQEIWERTDVILIEQQLSSLNIQAARLACHVSAYFFHKHKNVPVFDYPASFKTKLLGETKKTTHRERKQFAIQKVLDEYSQQDPVLWDWMSCFPKKDDIADCILMCCTFGKSPFYSKIKI